MNKRNLNSVTTKLEEIFKSENVKYKVINHNTLQFDGRDILYTNKYKEKKKPIIMQVNVTDDIYELTYAFLITYDDELSVLKCINDANCSLDTKFCLQSIDGIKTIEFHTITFNEVSLKVLFEATRNLNNEVMMICTMFHMNGIAVEITHPTWIK